MLNTTTIRIGRATLTVNLVERKDTLRLVIGEASGLWEAQDKLRLAGYEAEAKLLDRKVRALAHKACAEYLTRDTYTAIAASAVYVEGSTLTAELADSDSRSATIAVLTEVMERLQSIASNL